MICCARHIVECVPWLCSMLADVQTLGATIRGGRSMRSGHLVGRLPWSLRSDAYGRSDVGTTFRGGGVLMRSGHLGECVPWSLCSDAYRRSDVGRNLSGRFGSDALGILSSGCRGRSALMLTDVQTWAQPFGAVVFCLVEWLPWSLGSDAYGRSDVGTTIRGGRVLSCRVVAVALL